MKAVSNNIINYLKSINVSGSNKHEEYETDDYIISTIMITIKSETLKSTCDKYSVCLVCVDKKENITYDNLKLKEFYDINSANNYYNELKESMKDIDIKTIIETNI